MAALPIPALLALDDLTLRAHTEAAGAVFSLDERSQQLTAAQTAANHFVIVSLDDSLIAYAHYLQREHGDWFVLMLNIHPAYRKPAVLLALADLSCALFQRHAVARLVSNVYRTNGASLAFHQRLGFRMTRENAMGYEFSASLAELTGLQRMASRRKAGVPGLAAYTLGFAAAPSAGP